jgi:hypothetical protein
MARSTFAKEIGLSKSIKRYLPLLHLPGHWFWFCYSNSLFRQRTEKGSPANSADARKRDANMLLTWNLCPGGFVGVSILTPTPTPFLGDMSLPTLLNPG